MRVHATSLTVLPHTHPITHAYACICCVLLACTFRGGSGDGSAVGAPSALSARAPPRCSVALIVLLALACRYHLSRYLRAIKPVRQACGAPTTSTTAGDLGLAERQAEEKAQAAVGDESRADTTHVALAVQPQAMQRGDEESVNGAEVSVAEVAVQGVASESAFLGGTLDLNDVVSMRVTELRYVHPLRMLILIFSMLKKAVKIFDRLIRLSRCVAHHQYHNQPAVWCEPQLTALVNSCVMARRLPVLLSFPLSILFYVVYDRVRAFVSAIFAPFRILSHLFLFEIEVNFDVDVPGAFGKLTSFFSAKPLHVLIELTTKDGKVVPFLARDRRHWLQKSLDFEVGGYLSISTLADDELVMWTEADYNEYCTERSTFDPSSVLFQAGYLCVLGGAILVILFITDMADCLIIISTTEVSQCVTSFLPEVIPLPSGFFLPSGVISVFVLPAILFVTASILRWNKVRFDISFFRDGSRTALSLVSKDGVTVSTMQLEVGKTESYISYVRKRTEAEEYDYFTSTINFFSCLFCFPAFFLVRLLRCYTMGCNAALCSAVRPSDFNDRLSLFCYVCGVRQRAVDALRGYFFAKRHQIIGPPRSSIKRLGNYVCLSDAKGQYDANCNHEGQLSRTEWFDQHRSYWDKYHLGYNYRWPKPYGLWWWGCERRMVADAMYADPNCLRTCAHRSCCKDGLYDSRDSPDGIVAIGLDSWRQFHAIELVPSTTLPAPATSYRPESSAIAIPKQNDGIVENVDPGGNHHVIIRGGPPTTEAFRRYNPDALWKPDEWKVHIEDLSRFYHYVPHRLQPTDCVQIKEFRFDKFGGKMNVIAPLETPPKALEQPLFPGIITFTATDPMSFAIFPRFGDVTGLPSLPINISDTAQSAGMPTLGSAHSISAVGQQLASTKEVQAAQAAQVTLKSGLTLKGDADELLQDAADRRSRDKLKQLGFHKVNMPDSIFEASFPARATAKQKLSVLLYCLNEMAEELAD